MPTISNDAIRALYELCGNDDYPVEEYCIGCQNCEYYTFPCANCAMYVFGGNIGQGNDGEPESMDIDDDVVNDNDIVDLILNDDDRIPNGSESEEHSHTTVLTNIAQINDTDDEDEDEEVTSSFRSMSI